MSSRTSRTRRSPGRRTGAWSSSSPRGRRRAPPSMSRRWAGRPRGSCGCGTARRLPPGPRVVIKEVAYEDVDHLRLALVSATTDPMTIRRRTSPRRARSRCATARRSSPSARTASRSPTASSSAAAPSALITAMYAREDRRGRGLGAAIVQAAIGGRRRRWRPVDRGRRRGPREAALRAPRLPARLGRSLERTRWPSVSHPLWVCELGTVEYREALALQERVRSARQAGCDPRHAAAARTPGGLHARAALGAR